MATRKSTLAPLGHASGSKVSGTRPSVRSDDPEIIIEEPPTNPKNNNVSVYQQLIHTFDSLMPKDKQLLLILVDSFSSMNDDIKNAFVTIAEGLARRK